MPPPSPPHAYASRSQSANAPPSSLLSRDAPGGHAHRPGSSMSISSMLGSDAERPARDPGALFSRPSSMFANAPSSAAAAMSPPSAPARQSPLDQSLFRRSHTPEKSFSKPPLGRPYRSGSGGGSSLIGDSSRYGGLPRAPHSQYPEKPHSTHPSPKVSPADSPYEPRRMSFSGPIARSNSQPPNAETATRPPGYSPISRPGGGAGDRSSYAGIEPNTRDSTRDHSRDHGRFGSLYGDRRSEETAPRDRDRLGLGQDAKGSLGGPARYGSIYGEREREPLDRHASASSWEQGRSHPSSPETKRLPAFESGSGFGFGAIQSYTKSLGSQPGGSRQPSLSVQTGQGQPTHSPRESPYLSKQQPQTQRLGSTPATASSAGPNLLGLASASDDGRRKGSDELLAHRNLLAVGADGKRGGRASPLPQAVQGAQAPFIGASGEPSIKNELGRVFSGIGSGVGGVTAGVSGSGPSTPLVSSPFKRDSFTGRSANGEADDPKIARPPSTSGARRARKSRDEDVQMDLEGSAGLSGRGSRRARHAHHHHHQYVSHPGYAVIKPA